jgi:hypothetical protein
MGAEAPRHSVNETTSRMTAAKPDRLDGRSDTLYGV